MSATRRRFLALIIIFIGLRVTLVVLVFVVIDETNTLVVLTVVVLLVILVFEVVNFVRTYPLD